MLSVASERLTIRRCILPLRPGRAPSPHCFADDSSLLVQWKELASERLLEWLRPERYTIHTVDFGLGFYEAQRQPGELFRSEEEFGYRLESSTGGSLDALDDGFDFPAAPGSRIALVVLRSDALLAERYWLLGFLSIAAGHCVRQLALGNRFLTVLPLAGESPLVGATIETLRVPIVFPLRLPRDDGGSPAIAPEGQDRSPPK